MLLLLVRKLTFLFLPQTIQSQFLLSTGIDAVYVSRPAKKLFLILNEKVPPLENLLVNDPADLESVVASFLSAGDKNDEKKIAIAADMVEHVKGVCLTRNFFGQELGAGGEELPVFETRYFSPWNGVGEDPVNGSSHCSLAPLWESRLGVAPGTKMISKSRSKRGGEMWVQCVRAEVGDGGGGAGTSPLVKGGTQQVEISGSAVVVLAGELRI